MNHELLILLKRNGVKFINIHSIGYDHINIKATKVLGIGISNNPYSVSSIADFISLHIPVSAKTYHAINIKVKGRIIIIDTQCDELINSKKLVECCD